jgi:hypothetical protein
MHHDGQMRFLDTRTCIYALCTAQMFCTWLHNFATWRFAKFLALSNKSLFGIPLPPY